MGRLALACGLISAVLAGGAPSLAGASSQPSRAMLENFGCNHSSNSLNRWIEVTAVMRPVSGTERMEMRFQLQRKRPGRSFVYVSGGDLGKWIHPTNPPTLGSQPGDRWSVQKPVANLFAPAVYRFRVSFRWLDSNGKSLGTTVRLSQLCDQS